MGIDRIEVFCDGSVTNAVMDDPFTSYLGDEFVGRAMVVIPVRDYGLIEQTREGMVTDRGTAASTEVEVFAIRTALRVCRDLSLVRFTVHSDCQGAIELVQSEHVEWRSREQMYLPNSFFDKVLRRAGYLRHSAKTVKKRMRAQPHQAEAFELFEAPRREFRLSGSPLWARVQKDAQRHEQALGLARARAG